MSGFYVNQLKSAYARTIAPIIEQKLACPDPPSYDNISTITISALSGMSVDDCLSAAYAAISDHPECFYYELNVQASIRHNHTVIQLPLIYSPEEIQFYKLHLKQAIANIVSEIERCSSMWDKERRIFEYLQTHTCYNYNSHTHEDHNIIGPLLLGKGVCEGISKSFAVLCHAVGIPCIVVTNNDHMWNMVYIGGSLTHVDATCGAKIDSVCDYSYFNVPDSEIEATHGKGLNCIPACTDSTLGFYYRRGTLFDTPSELRNYLIDRLAHADRAMRVKLKYGNIEKVVREAAAMSRVSFRCTFNSDLNTAIVNI